MLIVTMTHDVPQGPTLLHTPHPHHGGALVASALPPPAQLLVVSLARLAHALGTLPPSRERSTHLWLTPAPLPALCSNVTRSLWPNLPVFLTTATHPLPPGSGFSFPGRLII